MNSDLPKLTRAQVNAPAPTERILQFGTGNFLKGFVNAIVEQMNVGGHFDSGIVAIKLRPGNQAQIDAINAQDGLFTLNIRGVEAGGVVDRCELIRCQTRAINPYQDCAAFWDTAQNPEIAWVVSNTTEAGIVYDATCQLSDAPALSFPAKFTQWLHHRFIAGVGAPEWGVKVICCELIEDNATQLRKIILQHSADWHLGNEFVAWLKDHCHFYNSLVDRIVPGAPSADVALELERQAGYRDTELLETEPYCLWAIQVPVHDQADFANAFPYQAAQGVVVADDLAYYRERKVRLLNGPHTATANLARLLGVDTVYQATQHPQLARFMQQLMMDDILPLVPGDNIELADYARDIFQRFENPFLQHEWRAISMNSLSKWRARLLPLVQRACQLGECPPRLLASLVCLLAVYRQPEAVNDGDYQAGAFANLPAELPALLSDQTLWQVDLMMLPGFADAVSTGLATLDSEGIEVYLDGLI